MVVANETIDTKTAPYDFMTVGSKMTQLAGLAAVEACEDIKDQLLEMGCQILRAAKHELEIADMTVRLRQNPHVSVSFRELALGYMYMDNGNSIGGPIIGRGKSITQGLTFLDRETGQGKAALDWTYGAQGVEIEVDTHTGDIKILKAISCFDVGKVMNDLLLQGQILGGLVQGLGITKSEELIYDEEGRLLNNNYTDYKIMSMKDIPEYMKAHFIETPQLDGPFGARGVGEHAMISVNAAIANAISNSLNIDLFEMPIPAYKLYEALQKN
jgi:CO/xanthine dehydrogenase Mo-binding subunit